ncbi:MAG: TIGR03915 family putative DNA repair protein [Clostridiales bacterium]|nr:TIGR03915 family putative DNA repair protein [Clostridiales bacterium]
MSETWRQVCYSYDGSFAGFLTCADESFRHHEEPVAFCAPEEERISLYPEHPVDTDQRRASAFYRQLNEDISPDVQRLVAHGFLTCIPERECVLWQFIRMARTLGQEVTGHLADRRVAALYAAVRHLYNEAHLLKGFTRFSDCRGLLWAEISPKNRVLPLLRPHFCARFNTETFIIFDDVHHEALLYARGQWAIRPIDHIDFPPNDSREEDCQRLWKKFYDTIAIEGRYNPRLRMSNVPKRYWEHMTELKDELSAEQSVSALPASVSDRGM